MSFKTEQASIDDADAIAELMMECSTSARIELEFGGCEKEAFTKWNVAAVRGEIVGCATREGSVIVALDFEGGGGERKIIGFAVWGWGQAKAALPLPEGTNIALRQTFVSELQKLEETHRPKEPHYELLELATSPRYQRRGIGTQLLHYGLQKADESEVKTFLSGSPMGVPVYRQLGFEEVGRLEIGLEGFGGEGVHVHVAMIREPNSFKKAVK